MINSDNSLGSNQGKYFDDFSIGDTYILPSRTQTSGIFSMFQAASGDNDPIHYDVEYCKKRGHPNMLAHGLQVFIQTAAGAGTFPNEVKDSLIGLIEVSGKMLKPVYREDTLYPELVITKLTSQNTTGIIEMEAAIFNHKKILVFSGFHKYLIKKKFINVKN
jgi:acyl dehydratase